MIKKPYMERYIMLVVIVFIIGIMIGLGLASDEVTQYVYQKPDCPEIQPVTICHQLNQNELALKCIEFMDNAATIRRSIE